MGNCLIKKLNVSFDNDNLPIRNSLSFDTDDGIASIALASRCINVNAWAGDLGGITLRNIGGTFLDSQGNPIAGDIEIPGPGDHHIYYSTDTKKVLILGRSALRDIDDKGGLKVTTESLKYATNTRLIIMTGRNKTGDLSYLADITENCISVIYGFGAITGNISSLADMTKLTTLSVLNNLYELEGDFSSWAAKRTSGSASTVTVRKEGIGLTNVKVNGSLLSSFGNSPYTLTFPGNGTVTCIGS